MWVALVQSGLKVPQEEVSRRCVRIFHEYTVRHTRIAAKRPNHRVIRHRNAALQGAANEGSSRDGRFHSEGKFAGQQTGQHANTRFVTTVQFVNEGTLPTVTDCPHISS